MKALRTLRRLEVLAPEGCVRIGGQGQGVVCCADIPQFPAADDATFQNRCIMQRRLQKATQSRASYSDIEPFKQACNRYQRQLSVFYVVFF